MLDWGWTGTWKLLKIMCGLDVYGSVYVIVRVIVVATGRSV